MPDALRPPPMPPLPQSFDAPLGRKIIELHVWVVRQGLLGTAAEELFAGFCRRLADAGVPLWRSFAAMRTLHPQWGGYGYSWQREQDAIEPQQFGRRDGPAWLESPFAYLLRQASTRTGAQEPWLHLRRHLTGADAAAGFSGTGNIRSRGRLGLFRRDRPLRCQGRPFTRHWRRILLRDRSTRWISRR